MNDPKLPRPPQPPDSSDRPPAPRPDGAVMTQHPTFPPPPAQSSRTTSTPARPPADPQADVDTRELSLAALREAALRADGARAGPDVDLPDVELPDVDLPDVERQERAELEGTDHDEPADRSDLSPIDPRIRERRVAVTRAEGRRRLRILLTAVSVASAIGIAWLVVQSPFLAVSTVRVQGTARESRAAVEAAAGVRRGSALLFVDTAAVARRVEALPWVASAKVDRELPNDLRITVVERSPVAWVRRPVPPGLPNGTVGAAVVVDRSGRVLGDEPQPPAGLPELVGIVRLPERGGHIHPAAPAGALAQLPDALRAQTGSLVRRRGQAVLELVAPPGGAPPAAGEVRLGSLDEVGPKGAAALAVLDQLAAGGEHVSYVDVRVPGAPATR